MGASTAADGGPGLPAGLLFGAHPSARYPSGLPAAVHFFVR